MNLDELEAKARAAAANERQWHVADDEHRAEWGDESFLVLVGEADDATRSLVAECVIREDAEFIAAFNPDTVLHLIERARAGERYSEALSEIAESACTYSMHEGSPAEWDEDCPGASCWATRALAHSPQEA